MVWLDTETTGLDPLTDKILEVAIIITDGKLNEVARSPIWAIKQSPEVMDNMGEWCKNTHGNSGLTKRCLESDKTHDQVEDEIIEFLSKHVAPKSAPLCGNSIHQDRAFLHNHMRRVTEYLHYQVVDVTSFKIIADKLGLHLRYRKSETHTAMKDIEESIGQMKYYLDNWLAK